MGHMIRNHHMLDMGPEPGLSHLHPNHYVHPPVLPAPRISAVLCLQFIDPGRTNCVHAIHFNGMQYLQSVSSNYVGEVALANSYNPHMPSSSNGLVESRSSSIRFQPVPPFSYHHYYLLERNRNVSIELFGNCVDDGRYSNRNYTDATTYMQGISLNSGPLEDADMGIRGYQGNSSNRCAAFNMHHPSFSNTYQNDSHVQNLQVDVYSHHTQMPAAPYSHPFDNLLANNVYPMRDDQRSGFRFVGPMPSTSRPMDIPLTFEAVPGISYDPRNPAFEDASELVETSQFSGVDDDFDPYNDMRMDIDDMSYEELMELEERIGDVKTGLSEEFILKNLGTSMQSTSSSLGSPSQSASENGICIVCQVEYKENERIGTLDCGHGYHADCIKQWLAVKNICPICKAPALVADKREG